MDKIGQIRRTSKWLPSRAKMHLTAELLLLARIQARYVRHLDASNVYLIGPDPSFPQAEHIAAEYNFADPFSRSTQFAFQEYQHAALHSPKYARKDHG